MAKRGPVPKYRRLGNQKEKIVTENILKENPEGFEEAEVKLDEIVLAKHVPEYRKIIFLNGRDPGVPLDFHYASATHPLKIYKLLHGSEYNLPVEVIEHLESCKEPQYAYRRGESGFQEHYICSYKYIFQFRNVPRQRAA